MRKQTKLVAVLSAAALFAIGASMTSFAKGWNDLGNGDWEYLDSDGERVTNEWRRSSAGFCFLDEDGLMARNRLITPDESNDNDDNYYYVNDTGERRKNAWARVENEEDEEVNDQEVSVLYYYLGSNGKAYKAEENKGGVYKKVTINWMGSDKTFFFDENARMVSGWVQAEDSPDGKVYYCGDEIEGYAYTDWHVLDVPEFISDNEPADNPYEPAEYFCFESNGKMRKGEPGKPKVWYSNGWYYTFDENGVYQDDWYKVTLATENNVVATGNTVNAYTTYSGTEKKAGWVYTDFDDDGDDKWYYLIAVAQGNKTARNVPFNSIASGDKVSNRAKLIDKKTYVFDSDGKMLDDLQEFEEDLPADKFGGAQSKALKAGTYYFSKDSATKGQMMTGRQSVTKDGETFEYYFAKDGHAYKNAVINDIVYGDDGKRIQAEDGNKYQIVHVNWGKDLKDKDGSKVIVKDDSYIVVNARGKMVKTTATNTKGKRVKIDDADYIVKVDSTGLWSCELADSDD